jgi:hypothetical protein
MAYGQYPRGNSLQGDIYATDDNFVRDYEYRDGAASSARDYEAAGVIGQRGGNTDRIRGDYQRGYYSQPRNQDYGARGSREPYRGAYAGDGHRFTESGDRGYRQDRDLRGQPQGYNYDERGFFNRAGDEVRSWFGDEDAERRREYDQRFDERHGAQPFRGGRDEDYHNWRSGQIAALDRDYDEYRRENQQRFHNEFGSWRTERQGQRSALSKVEEHMDVVGSDGEHIGTVDKVKGDRILLTKSDPDAGGRHHSIPSRWIETVDGTVAVRKTAEQAKAHWRDEERGAFFSGDGDRDEGAQGRILNRSFSGTYR